MSSATPNTTPNATPNQADDITLIVKNTPFGVFIDHQGPLADRDNQAAWAARALLCRIDGIWADGQPVLLTTETEKAVNPS